MSVIASRHIPEGSREITRPNVNAVVYEYESKTRPCAIAYAGRKRKAAYSFWFNSSEERDTETKKFLDKHETIANEKLRMRDEKKNFITTLVAGDILSGSWGWEQTNVEFYEVMEIRGNQTIRIRRMEKDKQYNGDMSGYATPVAGNYKDYAETVRVQPGNHCRAVVIAVRVFLSKWDGKPKQFTEYA